jgi:diacylglycerol kinase family enzyme
MPTPVALLHNPGAGKGELSADELMALLRSHDFAPKYFSLKEQLDDPAVLTSGDFVIAAGGDGSVRAAALRLAHTGRPLAPLPLGTANNIAASLGIRGKPAQIVAGWKSPRRLAIDLGLATGPWGEQRFIEGVGVGLVGRAISLIESIAEASGHDYADGDDELHRDLCVFLAVASEMAPLGLGVTIDDHEIRDAFLLLEILNITRAGPRLELAANADMSDGFFDVISVTTAEREKLKDNLRKHFARPGAGPILDSRKARRVRITTSHCDLRIDDQLMLRCDDSDAQTSAPVTVDITVEPGALEILLPPDLSR